MAGDDPATPDLIKVGALTVELHGRLVGVRSTAGRAAIERDPGGPGRHRASISRPLPIGRSRLSYRAKWREPAGLQGRLALLLSWARGPHCQSDECTGARVRRLSGAVNGRGASPRAVSQGGRFRAGDSSTRHRARARKRSCPRTRPPAGRPLARRPRAWW